MATTSWSDRVKHNPSSRKIDSSSIRISPIMFYKTNFIESPYYQPPSKKDKENQDKKTGHGIIYISCGVANEDQISLIITEMLQQLKKISQENHLNPPLCLIHKLNYVISTDRETGQQIKVGYSFLWVKDERVYNALTGLNFDGSPRVKTENDPDWKPPKEDYTMAIQKATEGIVDWGEEEEKVEEIKKYYQPRTLIKIMPSLVVPGNYKYTPEQYRFLCDQAERINKEDPSTVPHEGSIVLSKAWIKVEDENKDILFCGRIPEWITEEDLFYEFQSYSSVEGFPKIEFNMSKGGKKQATLTFISGSQDAAFALLMTRKLYFRNRFSHCDETLTFDFYRPY